MLKLWQINVLDSITEWEAFAFAPPFHNAVENKKQLLEMAIHGEPKPDSTTPLCLAWYRYINTNSNCYDADFVKQIQGVRPDWFVSQYDIVNDKKRKLLHIAEQGEHKPIQETVLGSALFCYTCPYRQQYDPEFYKQIQLIAPQWFVDNVAENKKQLIETAKRGEPKPIIRTPLGSALQCYAFLKKRAQYDPEFANEIFTLRPDWDTGIAGRNYKSLKIKQQLLDLATCGEERPKAHSFLGASFNSYIMLNSEHYDEGFAEQIKKLRPDWLSVRSHTKDSAIENKRQLIEMAKNGESKPKPNHPLYRVGFSHYTNQNSNSYDPEFAQELIRIAPQWFIDTMAENKKTLLDMAINGESKPTNKDDIYPKFFAYTLRSSDCYDKKFDNELRELRPDWFENRMDEKRKRVADKKEEILLLAKQGADRPQPRKHPLGIFLNSCLYHSNNRTYDLEFTKKLKIIVPHWFRGN